MIKMVSLKCPECGANLEIEERKQCFCQYCGTKIMLDDGSHTYTHVHIDKTREKELEFEEKRLAIELKRENANAKWKQFSVGTVMVSFLLAVLTFVLVKDDFNISFNFSIMLVASIIAVARVVKNESMLGVFFISIIFCGACLMFMVLRDDFDTTFTVAFFMAIVLNVAAGCIVEETKTEAGKRNSYDRGCGTDVSNRYRGQGAAEDGKGD